MNKEKMTKKEISIQADVSIPTIELYMKKGLLPKASEFSTGDKGKGRCGQYPAWIVKKILDIKALTQQGYSLLEVKKKLDDFNTKKSLMLQCAGKVRKYMENAPESKISRWKMQQLLQLMPTIYGTAAPPEDEVLKMLKNIDEAKE
jgi:DNA-binding transcriptional MerR regulator